MGAWIEIFSIINLNRVRVERRTPRWVRGLKLMSGAKLIGKLVSHPTMGAWIEITGVACMHTNRESHPTMGAWIEIYQHLLMWLLF